jgi:hypothetical protein
VSKKTATLVVVDEDGNVPLSAFSEFVDVSRVHSYTVEPVGNALVAQVQLVLKFFDKDGRQIAGSK